MKKLIILPLLGLLAACNDRVGDFVVPVCVNGKQFTIVGTIRRNGAVDEEGYLVGDRSKVAHTGSCPAGAQPHG